QATYDSLENRIAEIEEKEDLARVRPDLDGNEIMRLLDLKPGPAVGRAWAHLKDVRLDRGPLDRDAAEAELLRWWAEENGGTERSDGRSTATCPPRPPASSSSPWGRSAPCSTSR